MIHRAGPLLLLLCTSGTLAAQEDTLDLGELRYEVIDEADFLRHREQGPPAVTEPGELTELGDGRLRLTHGDDTLILPERLDTCMLHGFVPALHAHYLVCFAGDELNTLELVDARTGTRMDLPYTFDNGFHGLAVSPRREQVLFFSSYDIPSWEAWYDHRADLITYRLTPGKGLAGMRTGHTFETGRFSMEEVVWVDDRSVAMKVYFGDQPDERNAEKYTYLKLHIP